MLEWILGGAAAYIIAAKKPVGAATKAAQTSTKQVKPGMVTSGSTVARAGSPGTQTANQPWSQPVSQVTSTVNTLGVVAKGTGTIVNSLASIFGGSSPGNGDTAEDWDIPPPDEAMLESPDTVQSNWAGTEYEVNSDGWGYETDPSQDSMVCEDSESYWA